jgi:hypothetical protein
MKDTFLVAYLKKLSPSTTVKDRQGRLVKVIHDDEEEMDCDF